MILVVVPANDKHVFVATKMILVVVPANDKHVFVATKMILVVVPANDTILLTINQMKQQGGRDYTCGNPRLTTIRRL